jgi:hypothetical protein
VLALVLFAQPAIASDSDWQCSMPGGDTTPALAQSASHFLARAGQIYPSQLLGMVRSGGRAYLVNANDGGWGERVRLGLMELRLAEPDVTAARRFQAAVTGAADIEMPAGEFVCLARARAGRHGLALNRDGAVLLAPGKSVHLVDPYEPTIVVEVKAVGAQPLDFREIFALSGRSGIYAGLSGARARPDVAVEERKPEGVIAVALGPTGRVNGEVIMTPRPQEPDSKETPVVLATAATQPVVEAPPARVATAEVPAAVEIEVAKPMVAASVARAPVAQETRSATGQSYEEYAKTMKSLLAMRRSGGVRSVSEMTYVHSAVEDWRAIR